MYKLLLVSDKPEVRELYEHFTEWEMLGFERPVVAANACDGIEQLDKGRFDAISSLLSVGEGKRFFAYLSNRPEMLGMETARDEAGLRREIGCARRTLTSRDAARKTKQVDDLTRAMQPEFFCDLLRGAAYNGEKIDERLSALKIKTIDPSRPVCTASFRLPQGEYFLSEVWRYGRERLENALKNIFEQVDAQMRFVLLVINPHHMRLIGLPLTEMTAEEAHAKTQAHLEHCAQMLEQYFELTLTVKRIVQYDSLYALGEENAIRTAH